MTIFFLPLDSKRIKHGRTLAEIGFGGYTDGMTATEEIRKRMEAEEIDLLILFSADPHLCENVPDFFNERKRLLGFRGSAGIVILTRNRVFFRTDSRYYLECERLFENSDTVLIRDGAPGVPSLEEWLLDEAQKGYTVAVNKSGIAHPLYTCLETVCRQKGAVLTDFDPEPGRHFSPGADPLTVVEKNFSVTFQKKLDMVRRGTECDAVLLTAPDTIAWLSGLRLFREVREDVFFYAWCLITSDECLLFTDHSLPRPLPGVSVLPYREFLPRIDTVSGMKIECSFSDLNEKLRELLVSHRNVLSDGGLRIRLLQTVKTRFQIAGIKRAATVEKRAVARLRGRLLRAAADGVCFTEADVAQWLEELRREEASYRGASFETIAAFGENGAVVHYKPEAATAAPVTGGGLLLLDCGIHTTDGTTDMTRVFWTGGGRPPAEAVRDYTTVLKAHIALARAVFPPGTPGAELDAIARSEAERGGVKYGHGTGHGVGWINCVHEPPFSISPSCRVGAQPGMVVSVEPGCYRKGSYGIRLENLYAIVSDRASGMLCFERITDFPFEKELIDGSRLTEEEKKWLDSCGTVGPLSESF